MGIYLRVRSIVILEKRGLTGNPTVCELPCEVKFNSTYSYVMSPKDVVRAWIEAFNRGNANELAEFYAHDAINHQVANDPVIGRAAIHAMFAREFATAKMVCLIENLFEDSEWAILEWRDPLGFRGCGFFRINTEGKIALQRGYWDKLSFLKLHGLTMESLAADIEHS